MVSILTDRLTEITALCEKHKVLSFAVFGSAASDTMNGESDIDFLVQFSEDINVLDYSENYFSLLEALEKLTGRSVELLSVNAITNPVLKEEISRSKIQLYAA